MSGSIKSEAHTDHIYAIDQSTTSGIELLVGSLGQGQGRFNSLLPSLYYKSIVICNDILMVSYI